MKLAIYVQCISFYLAWPPEYMQILTFYEDLLTACRYKLAFQSSRITKTIRDQFSKKIQNPVISKLTSKLTGHEDAGKLGNKRRWNLQICQSETRCVSTFNRKWIKTNKKLYLIAPAMCLAKYICKVFEVLFFSISRKLVSRIRVRESSLSRVCIKISQTALCEFGHGNPFVWEKYGQSLYVNFTNVKKVVKKSTTQHWSYNWLRIIDHNQLNFSRTHFRFC